MISLRGCAGWSPPLLFANPEDRISRVKVHIELSKLAKKSEYHPIGLNVLVPFVLDIFYCKAIGNIEMHEMFGLGWGDSLSLVIKPTTIYVCGGVYCFHDDQLFHVSLRDV